MENFVFCSVSKAKMGKQYFYRLKNILEEYCDQQKKKKIDAFDHRV